MWAAILDEDGRWVQTLLTAGADINSRDVAGRTALRNAAERGESPEVIAVLLRAGADARATDAQGKTALDYARQNEKIRGTYVLRELQDATARP
jgi:ankyrin repeat protein